MNAIPHGKLTQSKEIPTACLRKWTSFTRIYGRSDILFKKLSLQEQLQHMTAENNQLKNEASALGVGVSEGEIQEIIQGQQISDLEIQILEIQMGGI